MDPRIAEKAESYSQYGHRRHWWQRIVSMLTCIVVFCTTYALILPAITMEGEELCGYETHTHTDDCYRLQPPPPEFVCNARASHTHDTDCENLSCGKADYLLHTHSDICYDSNNQLLCPLPQILPHLHTEDCFGPVETTQQVEVPHSHSDSCYTTVYDTSALLCTLSETQGHIHGADCYGAPELTCTIPVTDGHHHESGCFGQQPLTCQLVEESHVHEESCYGEPPLLCAQMEQEPHTHADGCYRTPLLCPLEEVAAHTHADNCYASTQELSCGLEEGAPELTFITTQVQQQICTEPVRSVHTHTDACFTEGILSCEIPEACEHIHTEECLHYPEMTEQPVLECKLPEHTHTLICYSDPNADLQSQENWENTLKNVTLIGSAADDLLAIAKTQLGYGESTANYLVCEDGITIQGYNRYGVWAGNPYAPWNQLFVEFCLHYADISTEDVPRPTGDHWFRELQSANRIASSDDTPQPGDLVFLTHEESFLTGIVASLNPEGYITAILGDYENSVRQETFTPGDPRIAGYFCVPRLEEESEKPDETTASEESSALTASFSFELSAPAPEAAHFAVLRASRTVSGQALNGVDIRNHITDVSVQWKENQYASTWHNWDGGSLDPDCMLKFLISYKLPSGMLPNDGIVHYQLPTVGTTSGSEGIVRNDHGTEVGTYYISPSGLISIDFNDEYVHRNQAGETIEGSVSFSAEARRLADNSGSSIDMTFTDSESIHIDLKKDEPSDLKVEKTAVKNEADGTIRYTIKVSSASGTGENVVLSDHMNANTYLGNLTVVDQYGRQVQNVQGVPNPGAGNFSLTLPPLQGGNHSYTISFTAKLGQVSDRIYPSNRAEASSKDKDGDTVRASDDVSLTFDYSGVMSKSGRLENGRIRWSVTLNPAQVGGNFRNWTLSDTINGIALTGPVTLRMPNGTTQTITLPYTFRQDVTGPIEISYITDADYGLGSSTVTNTATLEPPTGSNRPTFTETQHVDPYHGDESSYNPMSKSENGMSANTDGSYTVGWILTIDSAKGAVPNSWTLTDTLSSNQYFSESQRNALQNQDIPELLRRIYGNNLPDYTLTFSNNNRTFTLSVNADLPKLSAPVQLYYSSTTQALDPTVAHTFSNQFDVNNTVRETVSTHFYPTIAKSDSKTNSGEDSYHALQDLDDNTLFWTVDLHIPKGTSTSLTIYEDMPDELTTKDSTDANMAMTLTGLGMTVQGTYYPFTLTESGGSVEFGSYDITLSWVEGTNDFTVFLPADFVTAFPEMPIDFLITGKLPDGFVTTKPSPEGADYTSYDVASNTVTLRSTDNGTVLGSDTQNQYITDKDTTQYVDKSYLGHEESVVSYSIVINPNADDLVPQQRWLTVVDDLSYICYQYGQGNYFTASLDPSQIFLTLMDKDGNVVENGERTAITALIKQPDHLAHGSTYTTSTAHEYTTWGTTTFHYLLTLKVPDGYRVLIEYQYDLDAVGAPGGVQNLVNTAKITDISASDEAAQGGWLPITESDATANLSGIRIYKVDQDNYAVHLQGAHYDLYQYRKNADGSGEYQYVRSIVSDGVSQLDLDELHKNTAYYLVETQAPSGYILDESRHYFMVYDETLMDKSTNKLFYVAPEGFSESCHMRPGDVLYIENRRYVDNITVAKQWKNANGMPMDSNIPEGTFVKVQLYQVYSNYPKDFQADKVGLPATLKISVGNYPHSSEHYSNTTQEYQVGDIIEITYTLNPENDAVPGLIRYTDTENIQIPYTVTENANGTCTYTFPYRITTTYQELHGWTFEKDSPVSVSVRQTHDYSQVNLNRTITPYPSGLITLNSENDWYYTFENLPAYELSENGQIQGYYSYYFNEEESSLAGFTPTYDTGYSPATALNEGRVTIVNAPPPTTSIQVSKDWRNTDGSPIADPPVESIYFDVYQVENLGSAENISYAQVSASVDSWYAPNGGILKQSIVVPSGMQMQLIILSTSEPTVTMDSGAMRAASVKDLENGRKEYIYQFYANSDVNLSATTRSNDSSAKLVTARETSLSPLEGTKIISGYQLTASGGKLYTYNIPGSVNNGAPWTALINGLPASAMTDKGMVYYSYYVTESTGPSNYTVTYGHNGKEFLFCPDIIEGDLTIHNTRFVGDRIELRLTKKWVDDSGVFLSKIPESAIQVDIWQVITDGSGAKTERYYRTDSILAQNDWYLSVSLPAHNASNTLTYAYYVREVTGNYPVTYQIGNGLNMDAMGADSALGYDPASTNNLTSYPITITNTVTVYTLPETGGTGPLFCTFAGVGLITFACVQYLYFKRKKGL